MTEAHRPTALKLAVIGDPVAHSASPALHRTFLRAQAVPGTYEAIRVAAGSGARAIDALRDDGFTGLNVTTPRKEEAYARADERDAAACAAGAVNTLVLDAAGVRGYNTDGIGALGALRHAGLSDVRRSRVLVLGAGPTARAALVALRDAGCATSVWNRTHAKALAIERELGARLWKEGDVPDAVFATLPPGASLDGAPLAATLARAPIVIDANYGARATLGAALGRAVSDGAEMLAASARASFVLFRTVL
ncbi:MAG: shikimate dehydrogenase [Vulcanimicrobiaceae bacterium]